MIALVRVEIRRALSRQLVQRLVLVAVAAITVLGIVLFMATEPVPGGGPVPQPDPAFEATVRAGCIERGDDPAHCEVVAKQMAEQAAGDEHVRLVALPDVVSGTWFILFIAALSAAGSFIGAEWRYGTLAALLTWEPRRGRVLLAKAAAALLVGGVIVVLLQVLTMVAAMPAVLAHGDTVGADSAFWSDTVGVVLRAAAVADLAIVVGFAVATVTRNAAAAIGGAFLWFAVLETLLRGLRPSWNHWLIGNNAAVFLQGAESGLVGRSMAAAGLYLLALSVALLGAATLWFTRIDVQ